jgi:hypothetical protein
MTNKDRVCRCCMQVAKTEADLHDFSSELEIEINEQTPSFIKINSIYFML